MPRIRVIQRLGSAALTRQAATPATNVKRMSVPTYTLNDGSTLPAVGFGTYPMRGEEGVAAIVSALEGGYRLLDTAVNYENETEVGEALRRSGLPRDEVQVTSKIPGRHHAYELAISSTKESLERLGLDYLDLHLIHWPNPSQGLFVEAWRALVDLREQGLVRSIGVSNFTPAHLRRIIDETGVTPAVNQIEMHPLFPQVQMRAVHEELGIRTEAWSPMGKRQAQYDAPPVRAAASRLGVTPGQVILRWHVELGSVPIPKSATPSRQAENLDVFSFELTAEEVEAITALGRADGRLFGGDPETHEEM
ncbi:aldo/keto reductase [Nocardioides sp. AN3]